MRRTLTLAALLTLGAATIASAAEIPIDQIAVPVPADKTVRIEFPVGSLQVEASPSNQVTFDLVARCKGFGRGRCEEKAGRIHVESETRGGVLRFKVQGYPKFHADGLHLRGVLRVPADLALRVDMGVGELRIRDVEGDLDVELGVGEADIRASSRAIRSVDVSTGVGDATVFAQGGRVRHHSFISSSANWSEGRGSSSVNLNVGVGEGRVRVD